MLKKAIVIGFMVMMLFSSLAVLGSGGARAEGLPEQTPDFHYIGEAYSFYYYHATSDYYDVIYIVTGGKTLALELNFAIAALQYPGNASATSFTTQYTNDQESYTYTNNTLDITMITTQTWLDDFKLNFKFHAEYFNLNISYIANTTVCPNYFMWYFNQHGHGSFDSTTISEIYTYQTDRYPNMDITLPVSENQTISYFQNQVSLAPFGFGLQIGDKVMGIFRTDMHANENLNIKKAGYEQDNQLSFGEWGTRTYSKGTTVYLSRFIFTFGNNKWDTLQRYGQIVTKGYVSKTLPAWAHGLWYCTWQDELAENNAGTFNEDTVERWYNTLVSHGLRPKVIILDDKWMDHYGNYTINETRWPHFAQWVSNMHKNGTHVVLWIPIWRVEPGVVPDSYVVKLWGSTTPYMVNGKYYVIDPTNPTALNYLKTQLLNLVTQYNIDGFKIDFSFEIADYHSEFYNRQWANSGDDNMWHKALKKIYDSLHAAKEDIVISAINENPLYYDTMDMSRFLDNDNTGQSWVNMRIEEFKVLYYSGLFNKGIIADTDWYWQTLDVNTMYTIMPLFGPVSIYSSLYKGVGAESQHNMSAYDYTKIHAANYIAEKFPANADWNYDFIDRTHVKVYNHGKLIAKTIDINTVAYYSDDATYINSFSNQTLKVSDFVNYNTYTIRDISAGNTLSGKVFTAQAGHTYEIEDVVQSSINTSYSIIPFAITSMVLIMVVGMIGKVMASATKAVRH